MLFLCPSLDVESINHSVFFPPHSSWGTRLPRNNPLVKYTCPHTGSGSAMLRAFFGVSVCASRASSRVSSASLQRCRDVQGCSEVCRAVRVCRVCCRRAAGVLQVRLCAVCSGCTAWARSRRDARRASRRPFPPPRRRCRCAWAGTRERPRLAWAWLARPPPRRSRRERPARFPRSVASSEEQ